MIAKKCRIQLLTFLILFASGMSLHSMQLNVSSKVSNKDIATIIAHHIKSVQKGISKKDTLWVNQNVQVYTHNQGTIDSVIIDLSTLKMDLTQVVFTNQLKPTKNTLRIKRIKFFERNNKYEILSDIARAVAGGYSASYIYKRRKGIFKRWVYKRFVGKIWCGEF